MAAAEAPKSPTIEVPKEKGTNRRRKKSITMKPVRETPALTLSSIGEKPKRSFESWASFTLTRALYKEKLAMNKKTNITDINKEKKGGKKCCRVSERSSEASLEGVAEVCYKSAASLISNQATNSAVNETSGDTKEERTTYEAINRRNRWEMSYLASSSVLIKLTEKEALK